MGVLSITEWLPRYRRSDLRFDVVAGVTVAALVVPKALGLRRDRPRSRSRTGCTRQRPGALLYAMFGTSRQISTGPSSALAAVAASAVVTAEVPPRKHRRSWRR